MLWPDHHHQRRPLGGRPGPRPPGRFEFKFKFAALVLAALALVSHAEVMHQAAFEPMDHMEALYGTSLQAYDKADVGSFQQVPLTDEMRAEMNSLNSCGATDECEQSKLEFLFKLAGRKFVKNIVRDKLSEKIPELPPIVPPGPPTPNPPPTPPPPPLRPSTCLGSPCGALIDGEIKLGRCVVGTGGAEAACSRYGFAPFPENSNPIGCSRYSETYCHCCDTLAPVPPPVPPPIPPPIPPPPPPPPGPTPPPVPPPVFPPRPPEGQCGIFGSACVTYNEDVGTVFGTCFAKKYGDEAQPEIATCAEVGGVPALAARGCGGGSECICCVDGASLCAGTPSGNCGGGYCSCILTYNGANCNNPIYQNPPYPGYDPPPSTGGGCRENMCNAFAAQQGFEGGASCCPFCSA